MPLKVNHVWSGDPALDHSDEEKLAAALKAYRDDGDVSKLPLKNGKRPIVWQLSSLSERAYRSLSRTSALQVQQAMAEQGLRHALMERATYAEASEAFRRGLVGAEGATDENGRPLAVEHEKGKERLLTDECVEALYDRFGARLIHEAGMRVIDLCEVRPT